MSTQAETTQDRNALRGKSVLITGAARRVGASIARELHAAGASIVLHFNSSAADAAELLRELNGARADSAIGVQADLLDLEQLQALPEAAVRTFGSLDVLINNASTFYPTPLGEIDARAWDDLIGTNLRAPLFLAQAAASALRLNSGLILNIADIHGMRPLGRHTVYSVAKAGLIMLTRSLARELGPLIRVNAIAPGPVMWPAGGADSDLQAKILDRTVLKRLGSAQDIARAALFFATAAPFVTGQILAVDGGRSIGW
jgi:pteridine reductase